MHFLYEYIYLRGDEYLCLFSIGAISVIQTICSALHLFLFHSQLRELHFTIPPNTQIFQNIHILVDSAESSVSSVSSVRCLWPTNCLANELAIVVVISLRCCLQQFVFVLAISLLPIDCAYCISSSLLMASSWLINFAAVAFNRPHKIKLQYAHSGDMA